MSPIAGATSGLIAYAVGKNLNGVQGFRSWQWLFIIEGVITIGFSLLIITFLPGLPDTVAAKGHFLFKHEGERRIISQRTRAGKSIDTTAITYTIIVLTQAMTRTKYRGFKNPLSPDTHCVERS